MTLVERLLENAEVGRYCGGDYIRAADRIKELEGQLAAYENQEPVAYRHLLEDGWEYYDAPTGDDCEGCRPLYTNEIGD